MTDARRAVLLVFGVAFVVLAAGAVFGSVSYQLVLGGWTGTPESRIVALVLAPLGAAHLWAAISEGRAARTIAVALACIGVAAGFLSLNVLPLGLAILAAYAYVLVGLLRQGSGREDDALRRHLNRHSKRAK